MPIWAAGEQIYRNPFKPNRGTGTLPDCRGLGLEPNEDVLRETCEGAGEGLNVPRVHD